MRDSAARMRTVVPLGRVRVPDSLRRRIALLRLVHRPGAAAPRAPARRRQPLHPHAPARRAGLAAGLRDALGGDARGAADQTAAGTSEARAAGLSATWCAGSKRRVIRLKLNVKPGHMIGLSPLRSMYQLAQPPVFQTVRWSFSWTCSFQASWTSSRTSIAPAPSSRIDSSAPIT